MVGGVEGQQPPASAGRRSRLTSHLHDHTKPKSTQKCLPHPPCPCFIIIIHPAPASLPGLPHPAPCLPPGACPLQDKALEHAAELFASADSQHGTGGRLSEPQVHDILKKVGDWVWVGGDGGNEGGGW